MTDDVLVRKEGSIAWITLNRPDKRNSQGVNFTPTLMAALDQVENDPEVTVAILTGKGSVFGGGGDLKEIMSVEPQDPEWEFELVRGYNKLISRIYHFDRPIIAAMNGPAIGGGACLALACDFVIAADTAAYHFAFGRIGLAGADMGAPFLLQRHFGAAQAAYHIMVGTTIGAEEGKSLGLFTHVVAPQDLEAKAREIAGKIASQSRRATTITKLALRRSPEAGLDAALEYEAYLQSFAFQSEGHKQRLGAFFDCSKS